LHPYSTLPYVLLDKSHIYASMYLSILLDRARYSLPV